MLQPNNKVRKPSLGNYRPGNILGRLGEMALGMGRNRAQLQMMQARHTMDQQDRIHKASVDMAKGIVGNQIQDDTTAERLKMMREQGVVKYKDLYVPGNAQRNDPMPKPKPNPKPGNGGSGRAGTFKDTMAAVKGGHITQEDATQISPTYASKLGKHVAGGGKPEDFYK